MNHALNTSHIKKTNQMLILDAIYRAGTTSRTKLAKELSLSKPAISDNLEKLLHEGIVKEAGESSVGPAGGRKAILLQFNAAHKLVISVDLNFSHPLFVLGKLNGEVLNTFDISIAEDTPAAACMELVRNGIQVLLQSLGASAEKVYCIAVAAPGVYDREGNLVSFNSDCGGPAWWELNTKKELEDAFGLPVIVFNDVKAASLGEWISNPEGRVSDLFYLSAGLGIGAGLILNGAPMLGKDFNAGEIFDYIVSTPSGNVPLENTVCLNYLKEQCLAIPDSPFPRDMPLTLDKIVEVWQQGHPAVVEIVDGICERLATVAFNCMNMLSIRHVIFNGEYAPFGSSFASQLSQLFQRSSRTMPDIRISRLKNQAGVQGMIHLARERYFRELCGQ